MEIKSSLLNSHEFKYVKESLIKASEDDHKEQWRVKMVEYIDMSASNEDDEFFWDMMEFIRFLIPDDHTTAYTDPSHLIHMNAPGVFGENKKFWDFTYCHECLHQLWDTFKVGERIQKEGHEYNHFILNIASDCVINDYLSSIRKKSMPDGLVTPQYLQENYGVTYDRNKDTQYTLYLKLMKKAKDLQKDDQLQQQCGDDSQNNGGQNQQGQQGQGQGSSSDSDSNSNGSKSGSSSSNGGNSSNKSPEQQAQDSANQAKSAADKAKEAADKAQKDADKAKENGDKDAGEKQEKANKSKEAANKSKEAADKAQEAADKAAEEAKNKNTDKAKEAADKAAEEAKKAQEEAKNAGANLGGDKSDNNGNSGNKSDNQSDNKSNSNSSDSDSSDDKGNGNSAGNSTSDHIESDQDLERIKKKAQETIDKYKNKISGELARFIKQCTKSLKLEESGLGITTDKGQKGWNDVMKSHVISYVKKKVFQKQRMYKKTYQRVKRGTGVIKMGQPVVPGKKIRDEKLTINPAFYIDSSGSMGSGDAINHVWDATYIICESLKKQFAKEKVVDKVAFKLYSFEYDIREIPYGKRTSAGGGTMPFDQLFEEIAKHSKENLINIIITDGESSIKTNTVNDLLKDIDGLIIFITNQEQADVKKVAEQNKTKLIYILADGTFKLK